MEALEWPRVAKRSTLCVNSRCERGATVSSARVFMPHP